MSDASCRVANLIVDPPSDGASNMAADEVLLREAGQTGAIFLRFYQWSQPTLSLGYFQPVQQRVSHNASSACPLVRRSTGGGAIVHDLELTYSFAAPITDRIARQVQNLYDAFHETLVDCLASWTLQAKLAEPAQPEGEPPFLCFMRRSRGDVLYGSHKIAGSAQRRHYGGVLQHGSILLATSACAPELPGLNNLSGRRLSVGDLRTHWSELLAERLEVKLAPTQWSTDQRHRITSTLEERYAAATWNGRR